MRFPSRSAFRSPRRFGSVLPAALWLVSLAAAAPAAGDVKPGRLPPGHPAVNTDAPEGSEEELPAGHPPTGASAKGKPAPEKTPEDSSDEDPSLPPGAIVVEVRDAADHPVPHADVTLGILQQSVAKGESRRRTTQRADEAGVVRFDGLDNGAGVAYRVTVPWGADAGGEPATYAAMPFQLDLEHGQRVLVHVYPVTRRIDETMVGMQGIVYIELKDDALQFDELFQVYNVGAVTWVPNDVVITLPTGFRAFSAQKEMSDTGFDEVPGKGAKMHGTFAPGQQETHFRYQVPYDGDESAEVSLTLPPHVARMRVIVESSKTMSLHVTDFPKAQSDRTQKGQRVLVTERQLRAGEAPLSRVHIALENIPTEGSAKWITVSLSALTVGIGLFVAFDQEKKRGQSKLPRLDQDAERARARLVAEIAALDKAHHAGEVGPKAYARIRDALIDSLAHLMAQSA